MNLLCGVPDSDGRSFGFAFGLEDEIEPRAIAHPQAHWAPAFAVNSLRSRQEFKASNDRCRIWYAGAWLGDGLHEAAGASAVAVFQGLGGELL